MEATSPKAIRAVVRKGVRCGYLRAKDEAVVARGLLSLEIKVLMLSMLKGRANTDDGRAKACADWLPRHSLDGSTELLPVTKLRFSASSSPRRWANKH